MRRRADIAMKKMVPALLVFLLLGIGSCAERQDFDQFDEIAPTPTLEASMLYIETPERIINQLTGISFVQQTFNFDAFAEDFVAEHILEGVITYEMENTTSKPLEVIVEFLDENDAVLDTETFVMDPAPTAIIHREIAYGPGGRSIDIIRNTSAIRVSASNLGDTSSTSSLPDPKVIFRSSAKFRMALR